jgi:RimJ/RimL family protein N-acetyltransferase
LRLAAGAECGYNEEVMLILTTPRLRLRPVQAGDYPALRAMFCDPLSQRYESDRLSEADALERFTHMCLDRDDPLQIRRRWMITLPPEDTPRGWVHLDLLEETAREYEIGWLVERGLWNQGCATEGARAVLAYAFSERKAHRVLAYCHAQNAASERVMQKLGMTREGCLRQTRLLHGAYYDELLYAVLEGDPRPA